MKFYDKLASLKMVNSNCPSFTYGCKVLVEKWSWRHNWLKQTSSTEIQFRAPLICSGPTYSLRGWSLDIPFLQNAKVGWQKTVLSKVQSIYSKFMARWSSSSKYIRSITCSMQRQRKKKWYNSNVYTLSQTSVTSIMIIFTKSCN